MLDAGTNSGKTYFILKALLPWAYEHRKRILILCNREALRNQIERDAKRLGRIEVTYEDYDPALGETVNKPAIDNKYEHTIRVETYQWLETFLQRNEDRKVKNVRTGVALYSTSLFDFLRGCVGRVLLERPKHEDGTETLG